MKSPIKQSHLPIAVIIIAVAIFWLIRILSWSLAELWYDELLTLQIFVCPAKTIGDIFFNYRLANNHFLCSFFEWLWLHVPFVSIGNAYLLRMPFMLCGVLTLCIIGGFWQKTLGRRPAILAMMIMAGSAIFSAFAYQLRGYSILMLLSALACPLAHRRFCIDNFTWGHDILLFVISVLFALTMPSGIMVPCALSLALFIGNLQKGKKWGRAILHSLFPAIGAILGFSHYLSIWPQFIAATRESGGWTSGIALAFELLLALALHLGVLNLGWCHKKNDNSPDAPFASSLLLSCLLAVACVMLLPSPIHRYPFPRVFLGFLPIITYAMAMRLRQDKWLENITQFSFTAIAILPGVLIGVISDNFCHIRIHTPGSTPPQTLCWQYYRGNSPATDAVIKLNTMKFPDKTPIIVLPIDYPAFSFYFQLYGRNNPIIPANRLGVKERSLLRDAEKILVCTQNDKTPSSNGARFNCISRYFWFGRSDDYLSSDNF